MEKNVNDRITARKAAPTGYDAGISSQLREKLDLRESVSASSCSLTSPTRFAEETPIVLEKNRSQEGGIRSSGGVGSAVFVRVVNAKPGKTLKLGELIPVQSLPEGYIK